jgi:hypothetical protein
MDVLSRLNGRGDFFVGKELLNAAEQSPSHPGVLLLAQELGGSVNTGSRKTALVCCSPLE